MNRVLDEEDRREAGTTVTAAHGIPRHLGDTSDRGVMAHTCTRGL